MTDKRYTVTEADHAGYTHHVVDTTAGRVLAVCNTGTHRENRQDADHIARLLNAERDRAWADLTTYLAYEAGKRDGAGELLGDLPDIPEEDDHA